MSNIQSAQSKLYESEDSCLNQTRSVKEQLSRVYLDNFAEVIMAYINEHEAGSEFDELEDIRIKKVNIKNEKKNLISLEVVVEVDIPKTHMVRGDYITDIVSQWYSIYCHAEVISGLKNLSIRSVKVYNSHTSTLGNMSDALVPIIKSSDLDWHAEEFLLQFYPEALRRPTKIDPTIIVDRMGLLVKMYRLSSECTVFGQIFFKDCAAEIYDTLSNSYLRVQVDKGTILVDPEVFFMRNVGSINNTIIHECVHWYKHGKSFELANDIDSDLCRISCRVTEGSAPDQSNNANDWMEWQANALAPRILMPHRQVKEKADELVRLYKEKQETESVSEVMEYVIRGVAEFFCVSLQSAKYRLVDLGYEEALGHLNFIDDAYADNIRYKPGSIKRGQTFAISFIDAMTQYAINPDFRSAINTGNYVYVDKYFCINDPKYIQDNGFGQLMLTSYGREHADECLLVFDIGKRDNPDWSTKRHSQCVLFRDAYSKTINEPLYKSSSQNKVVADRSAEMMSFSEECIEARDLICKMPSLFSSALDMLIKYRGLTNEDVEECSLVSEKTVRRLRNGETKVSLKTLVALCIGLKLNPAISDALIQKSGCRFMAGDLTHIAYEQLIKAHYKSSIHVCNEYLESMKITPIP